MKNTPEKNTIPYSVVSFGSALLRVSPDSATIQAAITRIEDSPTDAFTKARQAAHSVTEFLKKAPIKESGLSRISLSQEYRFVNNERRPIGYVARLGLKVVLSQLDRIEEVLSGLVNAGANEISKTEFHTTKLRELRADARRLAMRSALEKAEIYAAAGGVQLGGVLEIQDVDPNVLRQEFHAGARGPQIQQELIDREPDQDSLDPSAIQVGAAVIVTYEIADQNFRRLAQLGGTMPNLKGIPRRRSNKR